MYTWTYLCNHKKLLLVICMYIYACVCTYMHVHTHNQKKCTYTQPEEPLHTYVYMKCAYTIPEEPLHTYVYTICFTYVYTIFVRSESAAEAEMAPRHIVSSQTLATSLDEELRYVSCVCVCVCVYVYVCICIYVYNMHTHNQIHTRNIPGRRA